MNPLSGKGVIGQRSFSEGQRVNMFCVNDTRPVPPVPASHSRVWEQGSSPVLQESTWPEVLSQLIAGEDLSEADAAWAMNSVMSGSASDAQIAGFLVALRAKGETIAELTGLAQSMVDNARVFPDPIDALDIVGTGGDRLNTVNISTMAALVCAGAGVPVIKHGNRAASSAAGTADVLEELGVHLDMEIDAVSRSARENGITFCFAQVFHPSMRFAAGARRSLGVPTAFNFLGPLTNPARVTSVAIGVSNRSMAPLMAGVLAGRGNRGLVFRGDLGLDELSTTGPSEVWDFRDGEVRPLALDATDLGLARATINQLQGRDAHYNAAVVRDLLDGRVGPVRDAVLLNAAAGLSAFDFDGLELEESLARNLERAKNSIDSGAAASVLQRWVDFSNSV